MRNRIIAALAASGIAAGLLAGCGGTNHDTLNPIVDIQVQHWWRLETPPGFATPMFACFGRDGIILDPDGNVQETPNDPMCPVKGEPYIIVRRHGSDPVVKIGGPFLTPPDNTGLWQGENGKP